MAGKFKADAQYAKEVPERIAKLSPVKRALLELKLKKAMNNKSEKETVPERKERETAPLSFAQQRLYFLYQLEPENSYYNIPAAWRLKGPLNIEAMRRAINAIVERHEAIRTTFIMSDGEPMQKISPRLIIDLPAKDLTSESPDAREAALKRLCIEEAKWAFNLEKGPLLRCFLIRLAPEDHVLVLNIHHIISDGWSMGVLNRELFELYDSYSKGRQPFLPPLPVQYADYAVWQREWFQGEVLEKQLHFWKNRLSDAPPVLELPTDRPRPAVQSYNGSRHKVIIPGDLLENLKTLSRKSGATLYMTLLAGFQLLLHRYTNQRDILVGSPIAGRTRAEFEKLIGFFVNTIVLRTDFSGNQSFRALLKQVREVTLGAFEHQDLPFEKLVEELRPERSLGNSPLIQAVFAMQNMHGEYSGASDLSVSEENIDIGTAKFDLTLFMYEVGDELHASMEYNTDLFDHATIVRMMGYLKYLLEGIVTDPDRLVSQLPLMDTSEQHRILREWNDTETDYPREESVCKLFELQSIQTPGRVAVVFGKKQLTYAELNTKANKLAHYLRSRGVGPETRIGICAERSLEMIVGLLGILKAGGAYVPLDSGYPPERLSFMIGDAQVEMLLVQKKFRNRFPDFSGPIIPLDGDHDIDNEPIDNPDIPVSGDQLAYVIYTSGSTGKPKGVAVVHRGIVRLVKETNYVNLSPDEVFLQFAPISFDAATFEIWGALLNGAKLVVFPNHLPSLKELGAVIKRYGVTTLWLTAGLFHPMVTDHLEGLKPIRQLLAGGDVLSPPLVKKALKELKGCRLINGYGPTENTTFTCCHVMTDPEEVGSTVSIGRPISNTQVYILDEHLQPVPIGVVGELYIGGDGLARGYLNRPDLTREKFIENPFSAAPDSRLYKTGDLVRYRVDGTIEFLGRRDTQVKIRGFRIELGEIESVIASHPSVQEASVIVREEMPGDKRIVAYIVSKPGKSMDMESFRSFLKDKLPEYMVPFATVTLDALPLNANGKIDRKALPAPSRQQTARPLEYQASRDFLEMQLAKIWEKALGIRSVGIRDNFFDLGGHSLLAIRMLSQVRKYTGKEIAVADLFKHPTVEQLANILRSEGWKSPFSLLIPFQPIGTKIPFYCIHGGAMEAANLIGLEQPFYGAFPHGYFGDRIPATVEEMAAEYVKEITTLQPEGPYFIGGYSFGGLLAFEIAHQLENRGRKVALLVLIDATAIKDSEEKQKKNREDREQQMQPSIVKSYLVRIAKRFAVLNPKDKVVYIFRGIWGRTVGRTRIYKKRKEYICRFCLAAGIRIPQGLNQAYRGMAFVKAAKSYTPKRFNGPAVLFRAGVEENELQAFWQKQVGGNLEIHELPGGHLDIFKSPQVEIFAEKLKMSLERAQQEAPTA